jgi:hypothetical protein
MEVFSGEKRAFVPSGSPLQLISYRGRLRRIIIVNPGTAGVFDAYDFPSAFAAQRLWQRSAPLVVAGDVFELDCPLEIGLFVRSGTDGSCIVVYQ